MYCNQASFNHVSDRLEVATIASNRSRRVRRSGAFALIIFLCPALSFSWSTCHDTNLQLYYIHFRYDEGQG